MFDASMVYGLIYNQLLFCYYSGTDTCIHWLAATAAAAVAIVTGNVGWMFGVTILAAAAAVAERCKPIPICQLIMVLFTCFDLVFKFHYQNHMDIGGGGGGDGGIGKDLSVARV